MERVRAPGDDQEFYIAPVRSPHRERRALKLNDTFAVLDTHGDINAALPGSDGLYHRDTRRLSHLSLTLFGAEPLLLGSNLADDASYIRVDLTNPDIYRDGEVVLFKDQLHVGRTVYVSNAALRQQLTLTNYAAEPIEASVAIGFDSDFADLFEVRGMHRPRRGKVVRSVVGATSCLLSYTGLDGVVRETHIELDPPPQALSASTARYNLSLAPNAQAHITLDIASSSGEPRAPFPGFIAGLNASKREIRRRLRGQATIETGNREFNAVLRRSAADLAVLTTETADGPYPYAGIPWFSTAFGRDGLITALEMLWLDPGLARGVLCHLARHQATVDDAASDAEPGKILHEVRGGEMAGLGEIPFGRYYGSVDSTPLFVVLAGHYARQTGDYALIADLWPNIDAALAWMDGPGDPDGDGFIEYARSRDQGLVNQGWKDSGDSIFHSDGTLAEGPIALVEVQAYAYEARMLAAEMARRLDKQATAEALIQRAAALKEDFDRAFWSDRIACYVLALDGSKRQCEVLSSNAGQTLRSAIAPAARAAAVADAMLGSQLYSGWGVRTIAESEPRYNPMSYHNGSVWPHDTALIAAGLAAGGRRDGAEKILRSLSDAAVMMHDRRLPELFCGFRRKRGRAPVRYPVACSPQAWASGAIFYVLQSLLGLEVDGEAKRVAFVRPLVPSWLERVTLRRLPVGRTAVDIALERASAGVVELRVLANPGAAKIELQDS